MTKTSPSNPPDRKACPVRIPPTEEPTITTRSRTVIDHPQRSDGATAQRRSGAFHLVVRNRISQHHHESVVVEVEMFRVAGNAVAVTLAQVHVGGDAHVSVLPWVIPRQ